MKKYAAPELEMSVFDTQDLVTLSILNANADENDIARIDVGSMFTA